jgi:putative transposase
MRVGERTAPRCGASRRGAPIKAIECLREAIHAAKGWYEIEVAADMKRRHDHGSQFSSHAFHNELKTTSIESSPSIVRKPEDNGCVERFIRNLKEQVRWLHRIRPSSRSTRRSATSTAASTTT